MTRIWVEEYPLMEGDTFVNEVGGKNCLPTMSDGKVPLLK